MDSGRQGGCLAIVPMAVWYLVSAMKLAKRTYSLPEEVVQEFEKILPAGERSAFLAKLMKNWLAARERAELRRQVIEGCAEMKALYEEIDREWESASDEVWRDTK